MPSRNPMLTPSSSNQALHHRACRHLLGNRHPWYHRSHRCQPPFVLHHHRRRLLLCHCHLGLVASPSTPFLHDNKPSAVVTMSVLSPRSSPRLFSHHRRYQVLHHKYIPLWFHVTLSHRCDHRQHILQILRRLLRSLNMSQLGSLVF